LTEQLHITSANVLRYGSNHSMDSFFAPRSVAVIGATEKAGSVGRAVLWNLISNPFGGTVFPVNPKRPNVLGVKAYASIAAIPDQVDLAVICTPAKTVPGLIKECTATGVKAVIVISAGFKEAGEPGLELERQILEEAAKGNIRVIGPNCLGVMSPLSGLNATFAGTMARPGNVAFISQSGALCTAVLDWSLRENVGFSAFVSIGSMLDVNWGDLIDYLGDDPQTKSIIIYMETIGDARSFLSAAREVALTKPIIVIKAGRTQAAAKAAASHTGSLAGSYDVLEAAFRRSGVLSVKSIAELFSMAEVLNKQPRPKGPRLTILTNAGGPGVLATDALIEGGGELATLSPETIEIYNKQLPEHWSHGNPVDILGDADPKRYADAFDVAVNNPDSDGLLVIVTPQQMTDPTMTAELLRQQAAAVKKPVLASWMGGPVVAAGEAILNGAGIPTFAYPDAAVQAFNYMWQYSSNLATLYQTPILPPGAASGLSAQEQTDQVVQKVRQEGRTILTEFESKQVLAAYGIPTVETRTAASLEEAVASADALGYPVVLKLFSETITHKTDVGGVVLNLAGAEEVRQAYQAIESSVSEKVGPEHFQGVTVQPMIKLEGYELIVGSSLDAQFGPVILFGTGGQLVEVYRDSSLALPPLTTTLARRLMERTRIFTALKGVRGRPPIDLLALEQILVRFSQLVVEQPWIKELDINPLLASPERIIALDARVVLHEPGVKEEDLPKPAIRPYPTQYVKNWTTKDGAQTIIRPIRPEDEPLMVKFHQTLSERSVYFRWLHMLNLNQRTAHERLIRICFIDYEREMALVAEQNDPVTGEPAILGVSRLTKLSNKSEAEFSSLVGDPYQGRGIGTELLKQLINVGRSEKLSRIIGYIHPENQDMQRISQKLGFKQEYLGDENLFKVVLDL
jgi:acetyltransferase